MYGRSIQDSVEGLKIPMRLTIERVSVKYEHGKYMFGHISIRKGHTEMYMARIIHLSTKTIQNFADLDVHGPCFEESND